MDVKFKWKARLVANGHEPEFLSKWDTYSSVVSRYLVRIEFLYAAFNYLGVLTCKISKTYLEAPCGEKIWTVIGK